MHKDSGCAGGGEVHRYGMHAVVGVCDEGGVSCACPRKSHY